MLGDTYLSDLQTKELITHYKRINEHIPRPPRRSDILGKMRKYPKWCPELAEQLLTSKFTAHLNIQDIEKNMDQLMRDFPSLVRV